MNPFSSAGRKTRNVRTAIAAGIASAAGQPPGGQSVDALETGEAAPAL